MSFVRMYVLLLVDVYSDHYVRCALESFESSRIIITFAWVLDLIGSPAKRALESSSF
jgi:hypothetical protein